MQSNKAFLVVVSVLLISSMPEHACAPTFDYFSTAEALAEVGWHDYFGYYSDVAYDSNEAANAQSYTSAYYDRIQYAGEVGVSIRASAAIEPNEVFLSTTLAGSYKFDVGWDLLDYFRQSAYCDVEGQLQITEFPLATPCSLRVNVSFPEATWTGGYEWQLYLESSTGYFNCGRDSYGDYGSLSGILTAYAGEQIYVFMGHAGTGYAQKNPDFRRLGDGSLKITATLTPAPHPVDLNFDGWVNFEDFAMFSSQWLRQGCEDPNTDWCQKADLDHSGKVDVNDLGLFTQYWLLLPDPNQIR